MTINLSTANEFIARHIGLSINAVRRDLPECEPGQISLPVHLCLRRPRQCTGRTQCLGPLPAIGQHGLCRIRHWRVSWRPARFGPVLPHDQCAPFVVQHLQSGRPDRLAHLLREELIFWRLMGRAEAPPGSLPYGFKEHSVVSGKTGL